ncbi:hypothetical protein C4B63_392g11 [Trypanosoma cruzi]|uniref:Uncharacterized protein n=1 Tax=Trypanosoma cruzi TaxID=5693 RepID=A0A2V2UGI8_TRYCR|nr:hypothetical protein C4B63_392g11 [Trypanosoma cruzi]
MSRADKRQHRDHVVGTSRDASVRLYAFATTRPRYQVVFFPRKARYCAQDEERVGASAPLQSVGPACLPFVLPTPQHDTCHVRC